MADQTTNPSGSHAAAVGYMLIAVICISLTPLWIAWGGGGDGPFFFNAALRLSVAIVSITYLLVCHKSLLFNSGIIALVRKKIISWMVFFATISMFDFAAFAWSTRFIDISIAAILFELWAIFIVFLLYWLYRNDRADEKPVYRKMTAATVILLVYGFIGVAFVVSSQSNEFALTNISSFATLLFGVLLAIGGAIITTLISFNFKWSSDIAARATKIVPHIDIQSLDMFAVLLGFAVSNSVAFVASLIIGNIIGEFATFDATMIVLIGGIAQGIGGIFWRKSNLISDSPTINAIAYGIPVLSLGWLTLFSFVGVARPDYLVIGAAAIITANLLINFEAEIRFGFKALILALWSCGAFVYLRDDFLIYLPFDGWLWPRETYLGALGFSATVFILLLTFRVARLAPRTQDEDNRIFALHRNLELLARRGLIAPEASEHVRAIDGSRNVEELRRAYTRAKLCFVQAAAVDLPLADRRLLTNAETQLNMMVHSRQQGVDFGELFALIIFGGSTVLLSLLSRPEVSGWTAFLYEVFSALFPAVIIFLIVNVWDLHRDRANLVLATQEGPEGYGVIFRDPRSRRFEQGVSVVIGWLIIAAYAVLLWYKWIN